MALENWVPPLGSTKCSVNLIKDVNERNLLGSPDIGPYHQVRPDCDLMRCEESP